MAIRRLSVKFRRDDAMRVTRVALDGLKLVYIIVADRKLNYPKGRSKVAYIGTTRNGAARIAQSAAYRANEILGLHGVRSLRVYVVMCRPRQRVKTWTKLERAFLLSFREKFGVIPVCNSQGKGIREVDEFDYFARTRIARVLEELA